VSRIRHHAAQRVIFPLRLASPRRGRARVRATTCFGAIAVAKAFRVSPRHAASAVRCSDGTSLWTLKISRCDSAPLASSFRVPPFCGGDDEGGWARRPPALLPRARIGSARRTGADVRHRRERRHGPRTEQRDDDRGGGLGRRPTGQIRARSRWLLRRLSKSVHRGALRRRAVGSRRTNRRRHRDFDGNARSLRRQGRQGPHQRRPATNKQALFFNRRRAGVPDLRPQRSSTAAWFHGISSFICS
jgi:hypothetical protein